MLDRTEALQHLGASVDRCGALAVGWELRLEIRHVHRGGR